MPSALVLFGKQVRVLRIERRLSQEKLAEMCEVHRNYISRVERAKTNLKFDSIIKLSAGLSVRPDRLFKLIPRQALSDSPPPRKKTREL